MSPSHEREQLVDRVCKSSSALLVERITPRIVRGDGFIGNVEKLKETGYDNAGSVSTRRARHQAGSRIRPSHKCDHGRNGAKTILQHLEVT